MRLNERVCICIPTKREPPVLSLESYDTSDFQVFIIADPRVYSKHSVHYLQAWDRNGFAPTVLPGKIGMGAQSAMCYITAFAQDFPYFFRMDDDLMPKTFVSREGDVTLRQAIADAMACLDETGTTHAGFSNTSRLDWLGHGFKRTYGLIHGGANIAVSTKNPEPHYIDSRLVRGEDVYRTCGHKTADFIAGGDGSVGRVAYIGFNKKSSTRVSEIGSSISATPEELAKSRDLILEKFGHIVSCDGTRWINNDTVEIPNWKHRRFPKGWQR
jgi:hypothetical protein